jgi:hypothetical protein
MSKSKMPKTNPPPPTSSGPALNNVTLSDIEKALEQAKDPFDIIAYATQIAIIRSKILGCSLSAPHAVSRRLILEALTQGTAFGIFSCILQLVEHAPPAERDAHILEGVQFFLENLAGMLDTIVREMSTPTGETKQ